jgi:predicted RNA-binding Zn ribbon-like protein
VTDIAPSVVPANPADVACIDLVNSTFSDHLGSGEWVDRIADRAWQEWFLDRYGLTPARQGPMPVEVLVALRTDVRRVLGTWSDQEPLRPRDVRALDGRIRGVPLRRRAVNAEAGLELRHEPLRRDWDWVVAAVAASTVELMSSGDPHRLKVCANPACSWVFYDRTINGSRQYCSTTPCASLLRVRRFRQRSR